MAAAAARKVETLRPAFMQSKPVWVDRVFDDPDAAFAQIRARGPYRTLSAFHNLGSTVGATWVMPWFRELVTDDVFLHNPHWIAAAKAAFSAKFVEPIKCLINLNGPLPTGGVHLDLPVFRGFAAPEIPVWLLMNMSYAGLFHPWMVPIASGLTWFWRGAGGAFEYWENGPDAAPLSIAPPMWNVGLMSDNEFMWHRVGPTGTQAAQDKLKDLRVGDLLHAAGDGDWEIRDGDRPVARFGADQMRISVLWKARVFKDEGHKASFDDHAMDLTLDDVVDIYSADLARKGVTVKRPTDPLNDVTWRETLHATYKPAIQEKAPA